MKETDNPIDVLHQVHKGMTLALIATLAPEARALFATALSAAAAVPGQHPAAGEMLRNLADAALAFSKTKGSPH